MQWLLTLETNNDMIFICRLMNIFRRKGLKITTLAMTARPPGFSLMAVLDRRKPTSIISSISCGGRKAWSTSLATSTNPSANASFVFIDSEEDNSRRRRVLKTFPESKLIFASHGKYLLEIPAESRRNSARAGSRDAGVSSLRLREDDTQRPAGRSWRQFKPDFHILDMTTS